MAHFIRAGYWKESFKGIKNWLNLEDLIESMNLSITRDEVEAILEQKHVALTNGEFNSIHPLTQEEYDTLVRDNEVKVDCIYLIKETI